MVHPQKRIQIYQTDPGDYEYCDFILKMMILIPKVILPTQAVLHYLLD
jgi:hypothetical protein